MSDYRIVQCFGTKKRPRKPEEVCRQRYLWGAIGATSGNFGRKGAQACPNCGTMPEFAHPLNRFLGQEISLEEAEQSMEEYNKNKSQTSKSS
jgi:hypothetical protein